MQSRSRQLQSGWEKVDMQTSKRCVDGPQQHKKLHIHLRMKAGYVSMMVSFLISLTAPRLVELTVLSAFWGVARRYSLLREVYEYYNIHSKGCAAEETASRTCSCTWRAATTDAASRRPTSCQIERTNTALNPDPPATCVGADPRHELVCEHSLWVR